MGAQDRTEKVLRDIHVLFSKAEAVEGSSKYVMVDKIAAMELLKELNSCMYEMMEEHELTVKSREKGNREAKKQGDDMIFDATRKAEDVYAASIMYMDTTLSRVRELIDESASKMEDIHKEMISAMQKEQKTAKENQAELKHNLEQLIDTQKYLRLIDEENIRRSKEDKGEEAYAGEPTYAAPEIHINQEYFIKSGQAFSDDEMGEGIEISSEDLDSEYFAWQEEQEAKQASDDKKKRRFFGKK